MVPLDKGLLLGNVKKSHSGRFSYIQIYSGIFTPVHA